MVDLPGQGTCPDRGLPFQVDMHDPIHCALDWVGDHAASPPSQVALYGVSGGGYFSAQAAAADPRVSAWVAATPIFDVAEVFRREFGHLQRMPGWLQNAMMALAGRLNEASRINLAKYAWQFGTEDFAAAMAEVLDRAEPVDHAQIRCPCLFLVSEGEGEELVRQTRVLLEAFGDRGLDVSMRTFTATEGADGHCQVNNLRLAHLVIFDWLDRQLGWGGGRDPRLVV